MRDYIQRLGGPSVWIRQFKCSYCGEVHAVEGLRKLLPYKQEKAEKACREMNKCVKK